MRLLHQMILEPYQHFSHAFSFSRGERTVWMPLVVHSCSPQRRRLQIVLAIFSSERPPTHHRYIPRFS